MKSHPLFRVANDLKIETTHGAVEFARGDHLQIEAYGNDGVAIIFHDLVEKEVEKEDDEKVKQEKVQKFALVIPSKDLLESILANIVEASELDEDIDYEIIPLADLIVRESFDVDTITKYMAHHGAMMKRAVESNGEDAVRIPVRRTARMMSQRERAKTIAAGEYAEHKDIIECRIQGVTFSESSHISKTGYLIERSLVEADPETANDIAKRVKGMLNKRIGENVRMRVTRGGKLAIEIKSGSKSTVTRELERSGARYEIEENDSDANRMVIHFIPPQLDEALVESYYDLKSDDLPRKESGEVDFEALADYGLKYGEAEVGSDSGDDADMDDSDDKSEGDPCTINGKKGVLAMKDGRLVCIISGDQDGDGKKDDDDKEETGEKKKKSEAEVSTSIDKQDVRPELWYVVKGKEIMKGFDDEEKAKDYAGQEGGSVMAGDKVMSMAQDPADKPSK